LEGRHARRQEMKEKSSLVSRKLDQVTKEIETLTSSTIAPIPTPLPNETLTNTTEKIESVEKIDEDELQVLINEKSQLETELVKYQKQSFTVSKADVEAIKRWLSEDLRVIVIQAEWECDFVLAQLARAKLIQYIVADDGDLITAMPQECKLLRNVNLARFGKPIQQYDKRVILENLKLSTAAFTDLCILMGCDYCERIKTYGGVRCYRAILSFENIEAFIAGDKKFRKAMKASVEDEDLYLLGVHEARTFFTEPPGTLHVDKTTEQIASFCAIDTLSRLGNGKK
jgi:hypothetical protein